MSHTVRQQVRRELIQCRKAVSKIDYYLNNHESIASKQHPEIAEQIKVIRKTNQLLDELIQHLWESL